MHCNTMQHNTTHCAALHNTNFHHHLAWILHLGCNTLKHDTTHCNTLQHTIPHCNTLQHTAIRWNALQHTNFYHHLVRSQPKLVLCCNTLQRTATRQKLAEARHTTTHYNALQHDRSSFSAATHCTVLLLMQMVRVEELQ